jgi:hypothetical protein
MLISITSDTGEGRNEELDFIQHFDFYKHVLAYPFLFKNNFRHRADLQK